MPESGSMVEALAIPDEEKADIGVLLVHGLGRQDEADTLLGLGEPLIDWLREWLSIATGHWPRGRLHIGAARLRAVTTETVSPAYA